jgi:hypothetical protein
MTTHKLVTTEAEIVYAFARKRREVLDEDS